MFFFSIFGPFSVIFLMYIVEMTGEQINKSINQSIGKIGYTSNTFVVEQMNNFSSIKCIKTN